LEWVLKGLEFFGPFWISVSFFIKIFSDFKLEALIAWTLVNAEEYHHADRAAVLS